MRLVLKSPFDKLWHCIDAFEAAFALGGEEYRRVKNRRTFRIEVADRGYFVKLHNGVGWKEIFKNLFQFKPPVLGADNEFDALMLLSKRGVPTMVPAAFGSRGANPADRQSFLVTEELSDCVSLEDLAKQPLDGKEKRRLIVKLAQFLREMHASGVNHRDCYLCHFLLDKTLRDAGQIKLYVIDLHRAQIRKQVPYRYLVKDVAGIFFSSMDVFLTHRDILRFIKYYSGGKLRKELSDNRRFWLDVAATAQKLYVKEHGVMPARIEYGL